ncbi:MAG TPA: hypothetical protein VIV61_03525 [Candidatus Ozemobacteraceae bacterium]
MKSTTLVCLFAVAVVPPAMAASRIPIELEEVREEISLLNLLRGLYLSKDQAAKILELARKAQALRDTAAAPFLKERQRIVETFVKLRDALYLPPGAEKQAQEMAKGLDHEMKEAAGSAQDAIVGLEKEVDAVLTEAQACIIEEFKPCLIPPHDLRNPVRVGQANGAPNMLGKIADLIHAAPPAFWEDRGGILLNKVAGKLEEESGAMSSTFKGDVRGRLSEIAARIRATSDVDYAVKRGGLAQELLLIDPRKALKQGHQKTGKNARWLLSDATVRVLPRWIEAMDRLLVADTGETAEDAGLRLDQKDVAARALVQLRKMYNKRSESGALPPYEAFIRPVVEGVRQNDQLAFLRGVRSCAETLLAAKPDTDLVRLLTQTARGYARWLELPLFHPVQDPYGMVADLEAAGREADPARACAELMKLTDLLETFRKP